MQKPYDQQERVLMARRVIEAMEDWHLDPQLQITLLGLPDSTRPRHLKHFRDGVQALPEDTDVLERARHVVGINDSLVRNHPMNRRAGYLWLNNRSKYFPEQPPLQVMLQEGLEGLHRVWANLDCTVDWE